MSSTIDCILFCSVAIAKLRKPEIVLPQLEITETGTHGLSNRIISHCIYTVVDSTEKDFNRSVRVLYNIIPAYAAPLFKTYKLP